MAVRVVQESKDDPFYHMGIEKCVKCENETRYWWHHGCMPLCPDCALTTTRAWCIEFAREEGYGPRPTS